MEQLPDAIFVLDMKGKFIRDLENKDFEHGVFVLGDHEGLPRKEMKKFKDTVSIGKKVYFASHTLVIMHHEMDVRGL